MSTSSLHHLNYLCLEVTDCEKFDTNSVLPRTMGHFVKIKFCKKLVIFRNKPKHGNSTQFDSITLSTFADMNFGLTFPVKLIRSNFREFVDFQKMP